MTSLFLDLIREQGFDVKIGQRSMDDFLKDLSPEPEQTINPFTDESIERMKNDNFYGQSSIDLSEVQKRLSETENSNWKQRADSEFRKKWIE